MSEKFYDPITGEEFTLDDLLEKSRAQMNSAPGEAGFSEEELDLASMTVPLPDMQKEPSFSRELPQSAPEALPIEPQPDFMPDFGDAFDDYGEYEEQPPVPLGAYEAGGYAEEFESGCADDAPPPEKPRKKRSTKLIPGFVKVLLYVVIVAVAAIGLGYGAWECARDVLAFGRSDESLTVTIRDGDTVEDISQMLHDNGVIKYPWLFRFYCNFTDSNETMDPGVYVINYNFDYHALVSGMIANSPNRTTVRVMIPEGMTAEQIFALMEKNNVCTAQELAQCAEEGEFDYWFLKNIPEGTNCRLEGFLFPDTYDFYENDDPERVLGKFLANFNKKFSEEAQAQLEQLNTQLADRMRANGFSEETIAQQQLDVYDLISVASMIEKESAGADESKVISSVIYNRLCNSNFPCLQIDATVVYALGGVDHALTYEDTQVNSPYNTYLVTGLPIGPIANPGLGSITAALYPSNDSYYYYALDKSTGYHHFSKTYEDHMRFLEEQNNAENET